MAEIDGSIPANANAPKPNPLGMASDIVGIRNALLQGQQQQQALQIGGQTLQRGQIAMSQEQLANLTAHFRSLTSFIAPLAADPGVTLDKIRDRGIAGINMGLLDSKQLATELTELGRGLPQDPRAASALLQHKLTDMMMQGQTNIDQLSAMMPPPNWTDQGGQKVLTRTPAYGQPSVIGTMSNTVPPTQTRVNPDLSQQTVGSTQPTVTGDIGVPAGMGQATGGGAPQQPTATGGPAPAPQGGPVLTAPPPGAAAAQAAQAELSAHQYAALQASSEHIPQQAALLSNMQGLLHQFSGGPAAEYIKRGESFINEMTGMKLGANEAKAYDSFQKQATQLAQSTFGALGGTGTDAKLDSAMHTNPNAMLSNMSNKEIIALLQGNLDALKVKAASGQAYMQAHGPTSFGQFQTEFNSHFDPRVFQMTHLDSQSRSQMLADMSKGERKDFLKAFSYAESQGWVDRNKLQGD